MIEFFLPMIPPRVTEQEHKAARWGDSIRVYRDERLQDARKKFIAHLAPHAPETPFTSAVRLITKWCFPSNNRHPDGSYKTTAPDTDNLIKLFKDCMTAVGFWENDALVASEITEKFWADLPGIYVRLEELE